MADYISRDEAIERIQPHVKPQTVYGEGYLRAIEHATAILELMPAADVQPVKRGRWIKQEGFWNKNTVKCSLCGNYLDMNGVNGGRSDANFCPNCGARMDGDAE